MLNYNHVFIVDDDSSILAYYNKIFAPSSDDLDILGGETRAPEKSVVLQNFLNPIGLLSYFGSAYQSGQRFPLCILDMRMPELNGLEAAIKLREIDPDINIIICSAFSDTSTNLIKLKLDNRVFYVHKPFAPDEFKLLVHSILREWEGKQALRQSEASLLQILDATRTGIWEWNIASGETKFSKRWAKMLGYTLEEISPTTIDTWSRFVRPEDLPLAIQAIEKHIAGESPYYDAEIRMIHKDGSMLWVHTRGQIVERDANGKAIRMSGTHTDITSRKNAEERLQFKSAVLHAQLESTTDGILVVDMKQHRVIANTIFAKIFQVSASIMNDEDDNHLLNHVMSQIKNSEQQIQKIKYLKEHNTESSSDTIELKNGKSYNQYSTPVIGKHGVMFGRLWGFREVRAVP